MTRRIAVFTSSRADLGPLGSVIAELGRRPDCQLTVIATGTHFEEAFGGRIDDVGLPPGSDLRAIPLELGGTGSADLGRAYARVAEGVSGVLAGGGVDMLVLLGDRWELLAGAGAALIHGVPIAHLHGGETTEGAIDDRIRHGVTKLADLHLCATSDSARRIRQLGEQPWRIHVTGAPGLDRLRDVVPLSEAEIEQLIQRPLARPLGLIVYHPPTVDRTDVACEAQRLLQECAGALGTGIALYPGADPGSDAVIHALVGAASAHENIVAIKNLGQQFPRLLASVDVMVGNSSSGIIEAASFHLPVVDVGPRQEGRLRGRNVVHAATSQAVGEALAGVLADGFRAGLTDLENPYGDGTAAKRIADILLSADIGALSHKPLIQPAASGPDFEGCLLDETACLRDAMRAIQHGGTQIALVTGEDRSLLGVLTDGDIRRAVLDGVDLDDSVLRHMIKVPVTVTGVADNDEVLLLMERCHVSQIPIVDGRGRVIGLHVMQNILQSYADEVS